MSDFGVRKPISRQLRIAVWAMTGGRCYYCGLATNPWVTFTVDHVVPVAHGGDNDIRNLVPCCTYCNYSKGTKSVWEWRPRRVRGTTKRFWFLSEEYRVNHRTAHMVTIDEWLMDSYSEDDEWEDEGES